MDTMNPPRNKHIRDILDQHFQGEIGVSVVTPEPTWWWEQLPQWGSLGILGWAWPQHNPAAPTDPTLHPIIVPYCPEIIDEQTGELCDLELGAYLTLIKYVVDLHIAYWHEEPDAETRHQRVDAELLDEMPILHRMLHDGLALGSLRRVFDG